VEQATRTGNAIPTPAWYLASDRHRPVASRRMVAHRRRDISDGKANAAVFRPVLAGGMEASAMMKRHLTGFQRAMDGVLLPDIGDCLAARQKIIIGKGIFMRDKAALVASRDEAHAPCLDADIGQGDPCRHFIVRFTHAPVGDVLVPGDGLGTARLLDEQLDRPGQKVGSQYCLDDVQNGRGARRLGESWNDDMAVNAEKLVQRMTSRTIGMIPFKLLDIGAQRRDLIAGQGRQPGNETVFSLFRNR